MNGQCCPRCESTQPEIRRCLTPEVHRNKSWPTVHWAKYKKCTPCDDTWHDAPAAQPEARPETQIEADRRKLKRERDEDSAYAEVQPASEPSGALEPTGARAFAKDNWRLISKSVYEFAEAYAEYRVGLLSEKETRV